MVAAEQVLEGEYVSEQPIDAAMHELFKAIVEIRKEVQENTISTNITHRQWADFWGKSKEGTSSLDPASTLDTILRAHFHPVKTSIVLRRDISLHHWSQGLLVMLKKVKGCSLVSKLRSIPLME